MVSFHSYVNVLEGKSWKTGEEPWKNDGTQMNSGEELGRGREELLDSRGEIIMGVDNLWISMDDNGLNEGTCSCSPLSDGYLLISSSTCHELGGFRMQEPHIIQVMDDKYIETLGGGIVFTI